MLSPRLVKRLQLAPFTYSEVGGTAESVVPRAFRHVLETGELPERCDFSAVSEDLLRWEVQRRAGFRVAASAERVEPGAVAILSVGIGPIALRSPIRVVYVIDEADRRGFAYGTLRGHPESGEESFVLQRDSHGTITFTVSAFSRPGTWWSRLADPAVRLAQRVITRRYLRSFG